MKKKKTCIITAADGNATAIEILDQAVSRYDYAARGREMIEKNQDKAVEQAGFLITSDNHFEMSGGEFCGNAARAAAIIFSYLSGSTEVEFTMSGFSGKVRSVVRNLGQGKYYVDCSFPGMQTPMVSLGWSDPSAIVDLGGIVHVVIEADFPKNYVAEHQRITDLLELGNREAVGVVWLKRDASGVIARIDPVVRVNGGVESFFYESSCGSGSIAAARFSGLRIIEQPSGGTINVEIGEDSVILKSEMEVIDENF